MTKEIYLETLRSLLKGKPEDEIEAAMVYCEEYIDEVKDMNVVLKELGTPKQFAKNVSGPITHDNKNLWVIILAILSAPLSIPLILALLAIIFTFVAVVFSMILVAITLALAAVSILVISLLHLNIDLYNALFIVSLSVMALGISLVLFSSMVRLIQRSLPWFNQTVNKVIKRKGEKA